MKDEEIYSIMEKYIIHRSKKHEEKVAYYALLIFDELNKKIALSKEERNLLKYCALLHDIGYYVDKKAHHMHSKNMILQEVWFEILPQDLRLKLALICGSHRKVLLNEVMKFNKEEQQSLLILISILRMADALEDKRIRDIEFKERSENEADLIIYIRDGDSENCIKKVTKKSMLMKEIFNINIIFCYELVEDYDIAK
jgi:Exopolyphosphatase